MPSFILKADKEEDFYVIWSTVVEAPEAWGSRKELTQYFLDVDRYKPEHVVAEINDRFGRADRSGTSAIFGEYKWDSAGLIYKQKGFLPREDLKKFLESYDSSTDEFDLTLLKSFKNE